MKDLLVPAPVAQLVFAYGLVCWEPRLKQRCQLVSLRSFQSQSRRAAACGSASAIADVAAPPAPWNRA